jgi:hypothetical protein
MKISPLQTLLAFKAVALHQGLGRTERLVAGALLDHFNRQTGQCDPSVKTLATLGGVSERTVIRATHRLVAAGLFEKDKHKGHFHRNSYRPRWPKFDELNSRWDSLRRELSKRYELSPLPGQTCPTDGDNAVTETFISNRSKETSPAPPSLRTLSQNARQKGVQTGEKGNRRGSASQVSGLKRTSSVSAEAARGAAQRRWDQELLNRFRDRPGEYAKILELLDVNEIEAATEAELKLPGAGILYVLAIVRSRGGS